MKYHFPEYKMFETAASVVGATMGELALDEYIRYHVDDFITFLQEFCHRTVQFGKEAKKDYWFIVSLGTDTELEKYLIDSLAELQSRMKPIPEADQHV